MHPDAVHAEREAGDEVVVVCYLEEEELAREVERGEISERKTRGRRRRCTHTIVAALSWCLILDVVADVQAADVRLAVCVLGIVRVLGTHSKREQVGRVNLQYQR